eukprot:4611438-Pyramimonas_sp.AAC.1
MSRSLSALGFGKRNSNQAKLGEQSKFYYNAELKMWLEEGKEIPQVVPVPTTARAHMPPQDVDHSIKAFG